MINKIFFSHQEISKFNSKLKDVIDSILTFIKYDITISPFLSKQKKILKNDNPKYKEWLMNAPKMTIINIITGVVPNEKGKQNAKNGIINIVPDAKNRTVKITHNNLDQDDVSIVENLLSHLLFDYYDIKVIESREHREDNLRLAEQSQGKIFDTIHKATRHNKRDR
jgi:hypothetical protein